MKRLSRTLEQRARQILAEMPSEPRHRFWRDQIAANPKKAMKVARYLATMEVGVDSEANIEIHSILALGESLVNRLRVWLNAHDSEDCECDFCVWMANHHKGSDSITDLTTLYSVMETYISLASCGLLKPIKFLDDPTLRERITDAESCTCSHRHVTASA